jgi:hypothetical protein
MLSAHELRQKLKLKPRQLDRLIKQGLPCQGKGKNRRFDPAAVRAWLDEHKLAREEGRAPDQVATTVAEAARILEVSPRCFANWLTDPSFPGKPGTPGRGDSYFPIGAIRGWLAAMRGGRHTQADDELLTARRLKVHIDNDRAQVALEKELRSLADAGEVARLIERQVETAKALLGECADKVESRLPAGIDAELRERIRQAINEVIAETQNAIAEIRAGDTDETDDAPDDEPQAGP